MKTVVVAVFASFCIVTGVLADDSCKVQAEGKNLHGAALTSFTKKCCNDQASAQKLHGAAKTSFTKKFVRRHWHVKDAQSAVSRSITHHDERAFARSGQG
jgi:hypothetical protein